MAKMNNFWLLCFTGILAFSCSKDNGTVAATDVDAIITSWLDVMNITTALRDANGIYYYPQIENPSGAPVADRAIVAIYYALFNLQTGNVIDSYQRLNGDPLIFRQGVSAVYPIGLDAVITNMRVGETYNFILPPAMAFKNLTSGAINPDVIAHLQIQVVGISNENDLFTQELTDIDNYILAENLNDTVVNPLDLVDLFTSGVAYKRIVAGVGTVPANGDTINLSYIGTFLDKSIFGSKKGFVFNFGSNVARLQIPGFEFGISRMQEGERALIIVPSSQAYKESALIIPSFIADDLVKDAVVPDYVLSVPPYRTLVFDVTRVD